MKQQIKLKWSVIIFTFFLLLAIFLRFFRLGENPVSPYWDEAAIAVDAYSLAETGRDMNNMSFWQPVFGSYGDFKAPVLIWLATASVKVFGYSLWAIRLPVAIASVLSLLVFYLLVRQLLTFDPKLQARYKSLPLLAFLLMAVSPWPLHFARIAFESSLSVLFFLLTIYLFLLGLKKNRLFYLLAALTAALGVYSYYSLRVILPLLAVALLLIFWRRLRQQLLMLAAAAVLFILLILPIFLSPYYARSQDYRLNNHNLITHTDIINESSQYLERYDSNLYSRLLYHRYLLILRDFSKNLSSHYNLDFLFFSGDSNLRQHSGYLGEFFLILLPFYLLGCYHLLKNLNSHFSLLTIALLLLAPIPAAMVYEVPHASRAIYVFIPLMMILALGLDEAMLLSRRLLKKSYIFTTIVALAFAINASFYYLDYFIDYPKRSSEAWLYQYNQVAQFIKDHYREYAEISIDGHYWFPEIFIYYQMPELAIEEQPLKNAFLNSPVNSFGFGPGYPYQLLTEKAALAAANDKTAQALPKARILHYSMPLPDGYQKALEFNLANGQPSLFLAVETMSPTTFSTGTTL